MSDTRTRLRRFLAGTELGVMSTILFVGLYTWPFLAFDQPGKTFRFLFVTWMAHIALIGVSAAVAGSPGTEEHDEDAEPSSDQTAR